MTQYVKHLVNFWPSIKGHYYWHYIILPALSSLFLEADTFHLFIYLCFIQQTHFVLTSVSRAGYSKLWIRHGSCPQRVHSQWEKWKSNRWISSVQFSCSVVSDSLRPHEPQHARPPCPSPTPRVHSDSRPLSQWRHPAISSSVIPFSSCPQSLPALGSFPMNQLFAWGGWMASLTQWTWVWVNSGSWWWTGRPGVLRFMASQRVGHDWSDIRYLIWSDIYYCRQ